MSFNPLGEILRIAGPAICSLMFCAEPPLRAADETAQTIRMTIDYGDGVRKEFTRLPWKQGATVLDMLQAAAKHPRGIKFTHRGKGDATLITSIDDRVNEGRGNNWTYEVNDTPGDRSAAVYELKATDSVLWKFGAYQ